MSFGIYAVKPPMNDVDAPSLEEILNSGVAKGFIGSVLRVSNCPLIVIVGSEKSYMAFIDTVTKNEDVNDGVSRVNVKFKDTITIDNRHTAYLNFSSNNVRYTTKEKMFK